MVVLTRGLLVVTVAAAMLSTVACSSSSDGGGETGDASTDAVACFVNCSGIDAGSVDGAADFGDAAASGAYSTAFAATENPISENGMWKNGALDGIDWGDVRTTPGLAFGTLVSGGPPYNDSTALLTGSWSDDQSAEAVARTVNQTSSVFEEVELRLRSSISAHSITGYEFNFRATTDGSQYCQIVRWNGALNDFTPLNGATGPGLHDGDVLSATAVGTKLTSFINGVECVTIDDATFASGNPGMGFYNQGGTAGENADFGFSHFSARDGT